jgi:hypothetical protein
MSGLKRLLSGLSLLLALSAVLSCGSGNSQSSSNPYTGHWTGTETLPGGNYTMSFQVQPNSTIYCFAFADPNNLQGVLNTGCNGNAGESFPFSGGSFSLPLKTYSAGPQQGDGGTFSMAGQFSSLTQANGTVVVLNPAGTPVTYTWTASLP